MYLNCTSCPVYLSNTVILFNGALPSDGSYACTAFVLKPYPDPQTEAATAINNACTKTTGQLTGNSYNTTFLARPLFTELSNSDLLLTEACIIAVARCSKSDGEDCPPFSWRSSGKLWRGKKRNETKKFNTLQTMTPLFSS